LEDGGTTLDDTPAVLNPEVREGRRKAISRSFMVRINKRIENIIRIRVLRYWVVNNY
jgi:hypothetical protein